jgi:hypothetical protein
METKPFWQSRTMWLNTIALVAGVAGWGAGTITSYPGVVCILVIIQAVGNLLLRKMTTTAITT